MAVSSRTSTELLIPKKWSDDRETAASPERNKVWIEAKSRCQRAPVAVIYYLSRNGHLDHPHFIEVSLSSSRGLYLRDVMDRLNSLRGNGMAAMYSWSCKRSYRNGYVWHDLSENDLIHPTNGHEYVLKGSELLPISGSFRASEPLSSSVANAGEGRSDSSTTARKIKNQSWGSFESHQGGQTDRIGGSAGEFTGKFAPGAAAQTESRRRRWNFREERENPEEASNEQYRKEESVTELGRADMSPPFSNSSKEDLGVVSGSGAVDEVAVVGDRTDANETGNSSGRSKASQVLKQLITCGSASVKPTSKEYRRYSMMLQ